MTCMPTVSVACSAAANAFGRWARRFTACGPATRANHLRNVHDHPTFTTLLRRLPIHPVYTPTEASWLNAIEAHFGVTKLATLVGSDDRDHRPRRRRIYRYLRSRNRRVGQEAHPLTRIRSVRPIKLDRH